jgi:PAS domain-containing protein
VKDARQQGSRAGRWFCAVLIVLSALAVALGAFVLRGQLDTSLLAVGAVLALAGLIALLGWIAGVFGFAVGASRTVFYDGLLDAIGDAAVVTDSRGRAVYSNAAFLKLASDAGA